MPSKSLSPPPYTLIFHLPNALLHTPPPLPTQPPPSPFPSPRYASSKAFFGFGALNEPKERWGAPLSVLEPYYQQAYAAVRAASPCAYVALGAPVDTE